MLSVIFAGGQYPRGSERRVVYLEGFGGSSWLKPMFGVLFPCVWEEVFIVDCIRDDTGCTTCDKSIT